jgi:hypothetical protein
LPIVSIFLQPLSMMFSSHWKGNEISWCFDHNEILVYRTDWTLMAKKPSVNNIKVFWSWMSNAQ